MLMLSGPFLDPTKKKERRDGPARESLASSLREGRELGLRRGEGRGTSRESIKRGVTGYSGSASPTVISVCCSLTRERAVRKEAEAGVVYWLLSRENPEEGESGGRPVPMGVATR